MRVNIIGNHKKTTGVSQDVFVLHGMLVHVFGQETQIRHIPHYYPQCPEAEVNIFIEVINPSLFMYASKNIWIPNPEWTYKSWKPYLSMVDEVWVKTQEGMELLDGNKLYTGWTSIDKTMPEVKQFNKAIVPTGKNIWRNPRPIIQAYLGLQKQKPEVFAKLPELHVVHSPDAVPLPPLPESLASKVILHSEVMSEESYDALMKECGLCICMSAAEGFGHAVNEAMSAGCILMLSPIDAFEELAPKDSLWVSELKRTLHPQCYGSLFDIDIRSLVETLEEYTQISDYNRTRMSQVSRDLYESRHADFVQRFKGILTQSLSGIPEYSLQERLPKEDTLPKVSVVTITRDRRAFMPLAKYCFLAQGYPEDKLEWVIVDDGKDQIKDLVSDLPNVKYVLCDEPMTIGAKRNLGVQSASHDMLVMMDDDDVYPNNSLLTRVAFMLAEPKKSCVFSTTIPCYDIHDKKSFMNVPPNTLPMRERVSEATLAFTRAFWEEQKFPDEQIAEGGAFIRGREQMCREVSPQDVIVSLVHSKNTSSRKAPLGEANGCHYGFSDELFTLVSEIGERL
jgi:glycosyltransferase involved in cell wall biosynthesis